MDFELAGVIMDTEDQERLPIVDIELKSYKVETKTRKLYCKWTVASPLEYKKWMRDKFPVELRCKDCGTDILNHDDCSCRAPVRLVVRARPKLEVVVAECVEAIRIGKIDDARYRLDLAYRLEEALERSQEGSR